MLFDLGYEILDFDSGIIKMMREHIGRYIMGNYATEDETHSAVFNKGNRIFPPDISGVAAAWARNSQQLRKVLQYNHLEFDRLCNYELERNKALDRDQLHIYWRAVRPNKPEDVGPAHTDAQFYEIEEQTDKRHVPIIFTEIYKIWVPVDGCSLSNALQVIPASHNMKVPTIQVETKNGPKPNIEPGWLRERESQFMCPFDNFYNKCVIFNDRLVHRGPLNKSLALRVSAEITVYIN